MRCDGAIMFKESSALLRVHSAHNVTTRQHMYIEKACFFDKHNRAHADDTLLKKENLNFIILERQMNIKLNFFEIGNYHKNKDAIPHFVC